MSTDAKTGQQIFSHHASLYSRNRRPFALTDDRVVGSKQTAITVTAVTSASLNSDLTGSGAGENGYALGNARYVHVSVKHATQKNITLYGYDYAFGEWAKIMEKDGSGGHTEMVASSNADGEARLYIFEVDGIDRVAFVSADAPGTIRAAASTF